MKREKYDLFINGAAVAATSGETFTTYNPATGEAIAEVAMAGKEDVDRAVSAARDAFENGKWKRYPVGKRARVMNKIAA
ncbi:MAG TPA: aldehyde dehydrogenase family protein, partial [Bacillales bacterium]|nr:aldehyde dehydrogenase family protein [Bacillales bacterium]